MSLVEAYKKIRPAIVAFMPKVFPFNPNQSMPELPPIIGTGFIVSDGIVITNDHVIKAIDNLPRPDNFPASEWPIICLLLHSIPEKGVAQVPIEVLGVFKISEFTPGENYYGPEKPDISFVHIKMKDLPSISLHNEPEKIQEGIEVATAGFPMGRDALTAPGYLHQLTPTLQKGIISAVLPFECKAPHALMINIMTQGGASGSPVFTIDTGEVIGVLYAGLNDIGQTTGQLSINPSQDNDHFHRHTLPANISYVVPLHFLKIALNTVKNDPNAKLPIDTPSLTETIEKANFLKHEKGKTHLMAWNNLKKLNYRK